MRNFYPILVLLFAALLPLSPARGGEADLSGSLAMQSRAFGRGPAWSGQDDGTLQGALVASVELRWDNEDGDRRASLIPLLRWDATDADRSLLDLREAYVAYTGDNHEWLVGANVVFWGVTESAHLVDIVNQTDFAGDIDGEDKLGQPMLSLNLQREWGEVTAFAMPYFRERTFPGTEGRFRPSLPVEPDSAIYESSRAEHHLDFALRYSHYFGDVDLGLSAFSGTSREPRFVAGPDFTSLLPVYDQVEQGGIDLQVTKEAWLWKLEAIARHGATHTFAAAVAGFEVTYYQVRGTSVDLGVLLEVQYDGRNEAEPVTIADNDVFIGARLALNDAQDTAVLAGMTRDVDTGEMFINVEAERRFGEDWFTELRVRAFSGAGPGDTTYWLQRDDYVQLNITRHF